MLSSGKLVAFLFTTDYARARDFFVDKLGCEFGSQDQFALVVTLGGTTIRISRLADFTPAQGTVLGWEVKNIEAIVDWLIMQGVTLERYPFVQDQERGIWTSPDGSKVAWFKDPDGNVLGVSEHFSK
jgi:catechol 2,3-dioxygenase-like lactoylglutathione lyase family enzyme